ncbi:Lsr2 family DNA-binding protein [Nonomuraea glycinis]|uniref:Lsr2 family DNA-binding protein n=1 Tax=Nonomuraea glycinis TaxID=2047744 RepID=UPI002E1188CE|nr:Lsr2 family protein [Nonomuraea glycinis]
MSQALEPDGENFPSPLTWLNRVGTAPQVPGHFSEVTDNLLALLRDIDADPLVDRTFTWPNAETPVSLRQVLHSMGSCGLFTREGRPSRVLLTPEARHFLRTLDGSYLIAVFHAHVRFFGEALKSVGEGITHDELNQIAVGSYGMGWKALDQVRRRVYWLRGTGMVEYWTNGKIVLTEDGRALLSRLKLVRPSNLESLREAANLPAELPDPPSLLAGRLSMATQDELQARKRVLGYVAGGANMTAFSRLVDTAATGLSRSQFIQFSAESFAVSKSSAEQSLNTLQGLDLLVQVGPDRFAATDLAAEWLSSGEAVDLIRHLHLNLALLGETLDALESEVDSATLTKILAEKYPTANLTRKDVTARVALLMETGLAERIGNVTRRTALGTALANSLPLQQSHDVHRDSVPNGAGTSVADNGQRLSAPEQLAAEVVDSSTDSANYQRFERALAEAFRYLGVEVEEHSGPAKTDVVVTLWLSPTSRQRIAVEAKTDGAGLVTDQDVKFMRLSEHRVRHQAEHSVLVGPGFDARVFQEANKEDVAILTAERLAKAVIRHSETPLYPHELVALLLANQADVLERSWSEAERRTEVLVQVVNAMWKSANDPVDIEFGAGHLDTRDIWRETKASLETPLDKKEIEEALAFLSSPCIAGVAGRGSDHAITASPVLIAARLRSLASAIEAKAAGTVSHAVSRMAAIVQASGFLLDSETKPDLVLKDIDPAQVRVWANAKGRPVNARGRLPVSLIREYKRAHGLSTD